MNAITTRRHPVKFYAILAIGVLFLLALGSFMMALGFGLTGKSDNGKSIYFMAVLGMLFYFVAFAMVYAFWKNSPKITIDMQAIKMGNETIPLYKIKDVALTGKMPFRFIIRIPMEGTALLLQDGTEKFIYDDMYANSWEIKLFLDQVVVLKQEYNPTLTHSISKDVLRFEQKETFKGNQFTTLRGISLWGLLVFFTFMLIREWPSIPVQLFLIIGVFGPFWFILNSWQMHYFELTQDYLIVKNHNFIWKEKIYALSDIKEVVVETQGNQPNSLRIITNDYRNKLFQAGTLRDKTWFTLMDKLEEKGVGVRNEIF